MVARRVFKRAKEICKRCKMLHIYELDDGRLARMRMGGRRSTPTLLIVAILMALLVILAVLQYRWLGELSEAEHARLRAGLDHAAARFCDDFDRELGRAIVAFAPLLLAGGVNEEQRLAEHLARWRDDAPFPEVVRQVVVVAGQIGGPVATICGDATSGTLSPCPWPSAFESVRDGVISGQAVPPLPDGVPGLVLTRARFPGRRGRGLASGRGPEPPTMAILVELDVDYIVGEMLPRLASLYFGGPPGQEYAVDVVERRPGGRPLFHFGPGSASADAAGKDVAVAFFTLRPFPGMGGLGRGWRERREAWLRTAAPSRVAGAGGPDAPETAADDQGARPADEGRWLLLVRHPAGSLAAAVGQARRRSLTIGLSVIALLGLSSILVVVGSQRAQRLARQQLDFVAAVSHELRTPLTAIHSAGQNLADGVVQEPQQVRRYGALIASEGRRLGELVARVLAFAGIRSGQPVYRREPVALRPLVDDVLRANAWLLEERGFAVGSDVPAHLPPVLGDPTALRQVLTNLVDNAVKFSSAERSLAIRASYAASSDEVIMSVSDRGRGIRKADLARIFEPFFRTAEVSAIPGSGLGLAVVKHVVEAMGGRVHVQSVPGEGTSFEVILPAAPTAPNGAATEA
jgi:signal transduction histidine kinase